MIRFLTGIGCIVGGIMIMPYYKQILDVLIDLTNTMFPTLNPAQSFYVNNLPVLALILIFGIGGFLIVSGLSSLRGGSGGGV